MRHLVLIKLAKKSIIYIILICFKNIALNTGEEERNQINEKLCLFWFYLFVKILTYSNQNWENQSVVLLTFAFDYSSSSVSLSSLPPSAVEIFAAFADFVLLAFESSRIKKLT